MPRGTDDLIHIQPRVSEVRLRKSMVYAAFDLLYSRDRAPLTLCIPGIGKLGTTVLT